MSKLDIKQIEHIAKLSRLELTEKEKELYANQLSSVLDYVEQLSKVNTDNVEPLSNVTGLQDIMREDETISSEISHAEIRQNAPEFDRDSFVVPGVFE